MGNLPFWLGIGAAQKSAGSKEFNGRRDLSKMLRPFPRAQHSDSVCPHKTGAGECPLLGLSGRGR
jgi:hypothetical protein